MSTEAMNEIIGTIKRLDESRKQIINNWVRKTHDKANIAIWAVKADEEERVDLSNRLTEAMRTGDWSFFGAEPAIGQAATPKATNPVEVEETTAAEATQATEEAAREESRQAAPEAQWEQKAGAEGKSFTLMINQVINEEVDRRLTAARQKVRTEVLVEFTALAQKLGPHA